MHAPISGLLLIALAGYHTDARLSGNRELIGGIEGLQTSPPTSAYGMLNGQNNDDPDAEAFLGAGGHGEQIADPTQFDDNGNAIYKNSSLGEEEDMDGIAYEMGDPNDEALLGGGGHGQQIVDPNQFDEFGNATNESNPVEGGDNFNGTGSGGDDPDDVLGGGGHGQQIIDPNQFDEFGNAIYDSNPEGGEENFDETDFGGDAPFLGGEGHGQQIRDPSQSDENGDAIDESNPVGGGGDNFDGAGSGGDDPDDFPLLGSGGHGEQITDPNQFDEFGSAIYGSNAMNSSGTNSTYEDMHGDNDIDGIEEFGDGNQTVDGDSDFDEFGNDSNFDGMGSMTMDMDNMTMDMDNMTMDMDNMDMMDGLNETDSGIQNITGLDGGPNGSNDTDSLHDNTDGNGTDDSINGNQDGDGKFPWDREESSAPSPAVGGSPSPAPIGEHNFGGPTYGQNSYVPLPTLSPSKEFGTTTYTPTSLQNIPTWDYPKPSSKPVVYVPPEQQTPEEDNNDYDDTQEGTSMEGTGGIGDYLYFDHAEPIEEMEHDRNVAIALGICGGIALCLAIITAQQMLENPHGCCAGICRILVAATCGVTRCICFPCRMICGSTARQERYSNELISGGGYNEEYISDLELT
ncbi:MAG: hypothetical protein SGBAC_002093 [Bacillariaceae sp.]